MVRKRKPINSLNEIISENEVQLFEWSFETNRNIISFLIENHIKKSDCKVCGWKLMVFGNFDIDEVKNFESKPGFYKINLDLHFLKSKTLDNIKSKLNIVEDEGFKPTPLEFVGVIIIYCE